MPPSALSTKLHRFISPDAKLRRNSPGYGAVSYGNIGSGTRLGFTLIRRDVNLVSRIQTACAVPWQTLLLSSFAGLLDGSEARPVGRYDPISPSNFSRCGQRGRAPITVERLPWCGYSLPVPPAPLDASCCRN